MTLSMKVAEWVDSDLRETLNDTLRYRETRLFAVNKTANGYVRRLIDSDPDPYKLIRKLPEPDKVDAYCLVMTGWMTRILDEGEEDEEEERFRVRVTAAVSDSGVSVRVRRWEQGNTEGTSFEDGGEGSFPDSLKLWWDAIQGRNSLSELIGE